MTWRQWCAGIGAAAALFVPLAASADPVPNLLNTGNVNGVAPQYGVASNGDSMIAHFNGFTTENPGAVGSNTTTGGSCTAGVCTETTWGVGTIDQVRDATKNKTTWNAGDQGNSIAFVIYGIADQSVTVTNNGTTSTEVVKNTGANTGIYGAGDGAIHIDLYSMNAANEPCFSAGCGSNVVTASNRTANAGTTAQVTGITNVGALFAGFTFEPGVDADGNITLAQSVTFSNTTFQTTGSGNNANFYAQCAANTPAGAGCSQFQEVPESVLSAGSFFPDLLAQIFGEIAITSADGATVLSPNGDGWLFAVTDPVHFRAAVPVPEPASLAIVGSGLAFLGVAIRRRRKQSAG